MTWIQTYTGVQFWPLDPRPEDVRLEDIAHALSLKCRFNGHCREFYSVAQHSVHVARDVLRRGVCHEASEKSRTNTFRLALLHDAAEAYLPDVCRPIKSSWPGFDRLEERLLECVCEALGVVVGCEEWATIKHCDNMLLATEARDLMGPPPAPWVPLPAPQEEQISPWLAVEAEYKWRLAFDVGGPAGYTVISAEETH